MSTVSKRAPRRGNKMSAQGIIALGNGLQPYTRPVRAKEWSSDINLLPFQGVVYAPNVPRAMPWAMSFLAFQATATLWFHNLRNLNIESTLKSICKDFTFHFVINVIL